MKISHKVLQHNFFFTNLLCNSLNILVGWLDRCITHLIFFYIIFIILWQPYASKKQEHQSPFYTSLNFVLAATFAFLKFCYYLPTFLRDGIFEGSTVVERVQDLSYVVGGEEQSIRALWLLPVFSVLFVVMHHHVEGGFPDLVWPHGMPTKITPFASLNRGVMTVPAEGVVIKLHLPRWSWMMPFHW